MTVHSVKAPKGWGTSPDSRAPNWPFLVNQILKYHEVATLNSYYNLRGVPFPNLGRSLPEPVPSKQPVPLT